MRGITRFEATVSAVALALTITGAVYGFSRADADQRVHSSSDVASRILKAAEEHIAQRAGGCPTLTSLKRDQLLPPDVATGDAWGGRFRVLCEADGIVVYSAGPDGKLETKDDIRDSS